MSASLSNATPNVLFYAASLLIGCGAGVIVNVLADGVRDDDSLLQSKQCQVCGSILPAAHLLPLVGFLTSSRVCSSCGKTATLRAPILSLALAVLFPLLLNHLAQTANFTHLSLTAIFIIEAVACTLLAFIFVVDLEHKLILDIAVYPAIVILILIAAFCNHKAFAAMLVGVIVYGGVFVLLYGLGYLLYRTEALGLGDVKLAILIGLLIGWPAIIQALLLGGLFGAAISILLLGMGTATRRTYIPYGIFMATGAVLALLLLPPYW